MKTNTSNTPNDLTNWKDNLDLLNLETLQISKSVRSKFPNFDFPIARGGCRLKKQLNQLADEIKEFEIDVRNSEKSTKALSLQGLWENNWMELYQEQLILQERYHSLYSFIQKFKTITSGLKCQTEEEAVV